jgi:phosphoenolpyruvate synthase/pyruvate phosphate dikinase
MAWTRLLRDATLENVSSDGGKNASLGDMLREVVLGQVRVPHGLPVTVDAFRALMRSSRADVSVREDLSTPPRAAQKPQATSLKCIMNVSERTTKPVWLRNSCYLARRRAQRGHLRAAIAQPRPERSTAPGVR